MVVPVHCRECDGTGRNGTLCRSALTCRVCYGAGHHLLDFASAGDHPPFTWIWG